MESIDQIISSFEAKLAGVVTPSLIDTTIERIKVCQTEIDQLRQRVMQQGFASVEEEIQFFKRVKPFVLSNLFYYVWLHNTLLQAQNGAEDMMRYYQKELKRIRNFKKRNRTFVQYIGNGDTFLDEKFFTRSSTELFIYVEPDSYCYDRSFGTSHDHILARILTNDLITGYIDEVRSGRVALTKRDGSLFWTDPKVYLVELIYGIHTAQSVNDGAAELNDIAAALGQAFNVDLSDIYRVYTDIKKRRSPAKYLSLLRAGLKERVEQDRKDT